MSTQPTDAEIDELWRFEASKNWNITLAMRTSFARAVEAEVRRQDEALIRPPGGRQGSFGLPKTIAAFSCVQQFFRIG